MPRLASHHLLIAGCTVLAIAAACTTGKPTTGAPAPGQPATTTTADPRLAALRRPLANPAVGTSTTVNRYWSISKSEPFAVGGFSAATTLGAGGTVVVTATAQVRLPNAEAFRRIAKTKPAFKAAQATADTAMDDVPDPASPYAAEDFTDAEDAEVLEAPHAVSMTIADKPPMSDEDDLTTFKDTADGRTLTITNDQDWTKFVVTGAEGRCTVIFNPDGTYQVEGKAAANEDAAVALLLAHPVVTGASPFAWGLAAARTGRIGWEQPTLNTAAMNGDGRTGRAIFEGTGFTSAAAGGADGVAQAHSLLGNLMRHLLKVAG